MGYRSGTKYDIEKKAKSCLLFQFLLNSNPDLLLQERFSDIGSPTQMLEFFGTVYLRKSAGNYGLLLRVHFEDFPVSIEPVQPRVHNHIQ